MPFHGANLSIETGWLAKQADGAAIVRHGDTMVLATVCSTPTDSDQDFFPLVVEYQEKTYAAGRIPGGFVKREGRPGEHEILASRLIDRPIRPLFADGFFDETQIICNVFSSDGEHHADVLAICAASAALHISKLPFLGPIAAVRVGRINGSLVINPSMKDLENSDLNLIVAASKDAIVMVEGGAQIVPESEVLDALYFGHDEIRKLIALQEELREKAGKPKLEVAPPAKDEALEARVKAVLGSRLEDALNIKEKLERRDAVKQAETDVLTALAEEFPEQERKIKELIHDLGKEISRRRIVKDKVRLDGRSPREVRPIECQVGVLPRVHGSGLFTRGETQALVTATIGTSIDTQRVDTLVDRDEKTFMLHYNFPPFSVGEVKMLRGASRREVGHGALAQRALIPVLPRQKEFPYVLRIVSEILESNGSSSMASVCGGTLSMLDAGVPIKEPVGGVAMGLIKEGDDVEVLTDILGDEDHFGDMDFKVCGTANGVTALQMDIKCTGLSRDTMERALGQAREGRLHILGEMAKTIGEPRPELSKYAPRITLLKINPDKIRDLIGPGGKTIQSIIAATGVRIDVSDNGEVAIASMDEDSRNRAVEIIQGLTAEAEIGKIYNGVVKRITDFGAFVEILPGTEGLVHISQLARGRVREVSDVVKEGDEVMVRVIDIDRQGRIRLSRKDALEADEE
ncbi:MAG TPA: polyribonucleotide nucleotidyltransferase [Oligoflexia bacterium]|nr:polyribonucleotide nucleotidyltransferase [Oligoflexia bacterium]